MKIVLAGATSDIGKKIIPLLAENYDIVALGRDEKKLAAMPPHGKVQMLAVDYFAENFPGLEKLLLARERLLFINLCAATSHGLFVDTPVESFRRDFDANVLSSVNLLRFLIPKMIAARWGRIIFAGTIAVTGHPGVSTYATTKSALSGLSNTLAKEYGRFGITSNVMLLGGIEGTPLWLKLRASMRKKITAETAAKRGAKIEELVPVIDMLAQSGYVNGGVIPVTGGM